MSDNIESSADILFNEYYNAFVNLSAFFNGIMIDQMTKPTYLNFNAKKYPWKKGIDYAAHPEFYQVGKGEQGVLICEPYKSEIGEFWKFKTPELAEKSSKKIYSLFLKYLRMNDFVGADMARKYLQMGFTRSRRYANYRGGRKYAAKSYKPLEKGTGDPEKSVSATIFYERWQRAEKNKKYQKMKTQWKEKFG